MTSASRAARSVQAQPAELPTPSLQALKQRAHQLLESQRRLQQQNQELAAERLGIERERDQLATQHEELSAERDALQAERDSLTAQLQAITAERDSFQIERDALQSERDQLATQHQKISAERNALLAESDSRTVLNKRDALVNQRNALLRGASDHDDQTERKTGQNPVAAATERFAIIYIGRCGSSYLQSLLDSHCDISCHGELLHEGSFQRNSMISDPQKLYCSIQAHSSSAAVGFKFSLEHLSGRQDLMKEWVKRSGCRCIHIKRLNRIDQFVSMRLAQINNEWLSVDKGYAIGSFHFDAVDLMRNVLRWVEMDLFMQGLAEATDGISISYENLVDDTQNVCAKVCKSLGITSKHLFTSSYVKQGNKALKEVMANVLDFH